MTAAHRVRLLLTALRPNREDAQAGERVQAVKGRLDAATPGPWSVRDGSEVGYYYVPETAMCSEDWVSLSDAQLIAGAPGDIAFLLARVDLLQGRLRDARESLEVARSEIERLEDAVDTAHASQWSADDEAEYLCGQVAELLPVAAVGCDELGYDRLSERIMAGEFGD